MLYIPFCYYSFNDTSWKHLTIYSRLVVSEAKYLVLPKTILCNNDIEQLITKENLVDTILLLYKQCSGNQSDGISGGKWMRKVTSSAYMFAICGLQKRVHFVMTCFFKKWTINSIIEYLEHSGIMMYYQFSYNAELLSP